MRLIRISANQRKFKAVTFNHVGLSFIVGVRTGSNEDRQTHERSYNGVGKSLLAEIVHFCLGSNTNRAFQQYLVGWEFVLEFEINGQRSVVSRSTDKQNELILNGTQYKLKEFNELLENQVFDIPDIGTHDLSFRTLLPRFVRRGVRDYNDAKETNSDYEPYTTLLRNLFLLGIDIALVIKKYQLHSRQVEIKTFEKNFKKDPFIREYYTGNKDVDLQIKHLQAQIRRLDVDLAQFQVAEDFYDIERSANELNKHLRELKNQLVVIENALHNIDKSLQTRPDISDEKIRAVYGELLSAFRSDALQKLVDVREFHQKLIGSRVARLGQERVKLTARKLEVSTAVANLNNELDAKLSYLSDKRALDQYVTVNSQRSELQGKLHKLQDYQQLLQKSRDDLIHIRKELSEETIKAEEYLSDAKQERDENLALFTHLAKEFYPEAPAGITLKLNEAENKIRYDFDVRIEADGSDGINAVKIFCYDLAVLLMNHNHRMSFIWHDSRLFSDIDPRQRAVLFRLAHEYAQKSGKQYIATVNQDQIEAMRSEFSESEFVALFGNATTVLVLKDDGPESKLLGQQIDMHYQ